MVDLISLLVAVLIIALVLFLINQLPLDAPTLKIIRVVAIVLIIIWLLSLFAGITHMPILIRRG